MNNINQPNAFKQSKKRKIEVEMHDDHSTPQEILESAVPSLEYSFPAEDDDHCETPLKAYEDIASIIRFYALTINKSPTEVKIYDPYFCEGRVVDRLSSLGFTNVYNQNEDFYTIQCENKIPEYDILVTNPPYSHDNIEKLISFCRKSTKPWLILVPNYVYMKDYYHHQIVHSKLIEHVFYIIPKQRYLYTTPKVKYLSNVVGWLTRCRRAGDSRRAASLLHPFRRFGFVAFPDMESKSRGGYDQILPSVVGKSPSR